MRRTVQSVGAAFALIAFILLIISVTTNYWIEIEVARRSSEPNDGLTRYSRHRGLYQECWQDESLTGVIQTNKATSSALCLYLDLTVMTGPVESDETYQPYQTRKGLLISVWAMMALAILFIVIVITLYLYTLCQHVNTYQWKNSTKLVAGCSLTAMILIVLGMGLFHGAEVLELNKVTDPDGDRSPYNMYFPLDMPVDLRERIQRSYGWSYALSWCAVPCALLATVLFMAVSCCYVKSSKKSVYKKPTPKITTTVVVGSKNLAYEADHERVVVAPPEVYVVNGNDHTSYSSRNGYDAYSMSQSHNSYSPGYEMYSQGGTSNSHSPNYGMYGYEPPTNEYYTDYSYDRRYVQ
ncbi:uncharacterized protein [Watersipora subatra]